MSCTQKFYSLYITGTVLRVSNLHQSLISSWYFFKDHSPSSTVMWGAISWYMRHPPYTSLPFSGIPSDQVDAPAGVEGAGRRSGRGQRRGARSQVRRRPRGRATPRSGQSGYQAKVNKFISRPSPGRLIAKCTDLPLLTSSVRQGFKVSITGLVDRAR